MIRKKPASTVPPTCCGLQHFVINSCSSHVLLCSLFFIVHCSQVAMANSEWLTTTNSSLYPHHSSCNLSITPRYVPSERVVGVTVDSVVGGRFDTPCHVDDEYSPCHCCHVEDDSTTLQPAAPPLGSLHPSSIHRHLTFHFHFHDVLASTSTIR